MSFVVDYKVDSASLMYAKGCEVYAAKELEKIQKEIKKGCFVNSSLRWDIDIKSDGDVKIGTQLRYDILPIVLEELEKAGYKCKTETNQGVYKDLWCCCIIIDWSIMK